MLSLVVVRDCMIGTVWHVIVVVRDCMIGTVWHVITCGCSRLYDRYSVACYHWWLFEIV